MADYDVLTDPTPQLENKKADPKPDVATMKAVLKDHSSTSYSDSRLLSMTKNDLLYACRAEGLDPYTEPA